MIYGMRAFVVDNLRLLPLFFHAILDLLHLKGSD
jgi:hypothetical protein